MTEHRDSSGIEPEETEDGRVNPSRRFARLIESPAARRVALPKLLAWIGILGFVLWGFWVVGARTRESLVGWVHQLPDQKFPFSKIELVPKPPAWIRSGEAGILEDVRVREKYDREFSLPALDLDELRNGFKHCPWVQGVARIIKSHGRLEVHLVYRNPVAVVEIGREGSGKLQAIDGEFVPLPHRDIDWMSVKPPIRIRGIEEPLIQLLRIRPRSEPREGVPWVQPVDPASPDHDDAMLLAGARLAKFLQEQPKATAHGRKVPSLVKLWLPDDLDGLFWIGDAEDNLILWGKAPGEEKIGDLSSEERSKMLLDWVDHHQPFQVKEPNYLRFTKAGAEPAVGKRSQDGPGNPR